MKQFTSLFAVALILTAGSVLAHDPPQTAPAKPAAATQEGQMDHSKMDMSDNKPVDHKKMATDEFAALDKNKDGKIAKAEVPAKHLLAAHFSMLDTNRDGTLSPAEFAKHHAM